MIRAVLVVAAMTVLSEPADACSLGPDWRIEPTLVEEVDQAYAVVIASVDVAAVHDDQTIPFVVREVFKGPYRVGARVVGFGRLDDPFPCGAPPVHRTLQYVLYLDKAGHPRTTRSIRVDELDFRYALVELVRIGALSSRTARNRELRLAVAQWATSDHARLLADIVRYHFATPTPWKPFAELWPMFRTADRDRVIQSIGLGQDPDAATFMTHLLHAFRTRVPLPREELRAIAAYFSKVHVPDAAADLLWLYQRSDDTWPWRREIRAAYELHRTSPTGP